MGKELLIGVNELGVMHTDSDPVIDLEDKFAMAREVGVYDYFDKTPAADQVSKYAKLAEKYDLPILAGGWFYVLGRDEELIAENIRIGGALGSRVHNVQIKMDHQKGYLVTDEEVAESYLRAYELGEAVGCLPMYEVHVNMWSEDFRRIALVSDLVAKRGVPFRITLDHSHVIFKINNPVEQAVFSINKAVENGDLILDPFQAGNICSTWIDSGIVGHCHARAAVPNNPRNVWDYHPGPELFSSQHPKNFIGRGIQYPFMEPLPGQWHSEWVESELEPWKEVLRQLLVFHANHEQSPLSTISTEFIPLPDYGGGSKYSIFENSVACAQWIRETWEDTLAQASAE